MNWATAIVQFHTQMCEQRSFDNIILAKTKLFKRNKLIDPLINSIIPWQMIFTCVVTPKVVHTMPLQDNSR